MEEDEHPLGKVLTLETYDGDRKCTDWLRDSEKAAESVESEESGSVFSESTENSAMDSGFVFTDEGVVMDGKMRFQNGVSPLHLDVPLQKSSKKLCDSVNMYKCKKVHIGDVMIVNGPLIVKSNYEENAKMLQDSEEVDHNVIARMNWLAQPALGRKEFLDGPAKYVIIYHTATEEGFTQAENTLLVRLIQTFHIESRKWSDIAYNFLVGSDGQIYEGRGWGVVGAHARGYNREAIAIAFIGCFLEHLPPSLSLCRARELIRYGVRKGHIDEGYRLLSHRQCAPVESPGRKLHEEVKTWEHWDDSVDVNHPAFVMEAEFPHIP